MEKVRAVGLAKAAEIVENRIDETLSYFVMPPEHWRCLKTNNLPKFQGGSKVRKTLDTTTCLINAIAFGFRSMGPNNKAGSSLTAST